MSRPMRNGLRSMRRNDTIQEMQPVFFIEVPDVLPEKGDESDAISGNASIA